FSHTRSTNLPAVLVKLLTLPAAVINLPPGCSHPLLQAKLPVTVTLPAPARRPSLVRLRLDSVRSPTNATTAPEIVRLLRVLPEPAAKVRFAFCTVRFA